MSKDDFPPLGSGGSGRQSSAKPPSQTAWNRGPASPSPQQPQQPAPQTAVREAKADAGSSPAQQQSNNNGSPAGGSGGGGFGGRGRGRGGRGRGRGRGGGDRGGRDCFICGSPDHLKCDCPYAEEQFGGGGRSNRGRSSHRGGQHHHHEHQQQPQQQAQQAGGDSKQPADKDKAGGCSAGAGSDSKQKYVDAHCHIEYIMDKMRLRSFDRLRALFPPQCEAVVNVFCDPGSFSPSLSNYEELLKNDCLYAAFGLHPHHSKYYNEALEKRIEACLKHPKAVAFGEIGLDYHQGRCEPSLQREAFKKQCLKAVELKKPIVVHSRDAEKDTWDILTTNCPKDWKIHIHCFNDSSEQAERLLKHFPNLFIGLTGCVTFKSAGALRDAVKAVIPLDRMLLETDGPYMVPDGAKAHDRHCHPGHIPDIAAAIATLKGVSLDTVYEKTRAATKLMYGI